MIRNFKFDTIVFLLGLLSGLNLQKIFLSGCLQHIIFKETIISLCYNPDAKGCYNYKRVCVCMWHSSAQTDRRIWMRFYYYFKAVFIAVWFLAMFNDNRFSDFKVIGLLFYGRVVQVNFVSNIVPLRFF